MLMFVAPFIFGGLVGWGADPILRLIGIDSGEVSVSPWVLIPGPVLSLILALAFHETGHITAGKLVGFRSTLFIVGPFKLYSTENGVRLGLNRSLMLIMMAGEDRSVRTRDGKKDA